MNYLQKKNTQGLFIKSM